MTRIYNFDATLVPTGAVAVATYDSQGNLLDEDGDALSLPAIPTGHIETAMLDDEAVTADKCAFPAPVVLKPNNASAPATVDLDASGYQTGTRVYVEPTATAATHNVTIIADGSLVDATGEAVQHCVLNASGAFAILDIIAGMTVLSAYNGADLIAGS